MREREKMKCEMKEVRTNYINAILCHNGPAHSHTLHSTWPSVYRYSNRKTISLQDHPALVLRVGSFAASVEVCIYLR